MTDAHHISTSSPRPPWHITTSTTTRTSKPTHHHTCSTHQATATPTSKHNHNKSNSSHRAQNRQNLPTTHAAHSITPTSERSTLLCLIGTVLSKRTRASNDDELGICLAVPSERRLSALHTRLPSVCTVSIRSRFNLWTTRNPPSSEKHSIRMVVLIHKSESASSLDQHTHAPSRYLYLTYPLLLSDWQMSNSST
jgi:hypothetical protein